MLVLKTLSLAVLSLLALTTLALAQSSDTAAPADDPAKDSGEYQALPEEGDPAAQYRLGVIYETGKDGAAPDYKEAAHWFLKAAQQGHAEAQWRASLLYEEGKGVSKDITEAYKWGSVAVVAAGRENELWQERSPRLHRLRWEMPEERFPEAEKWVLGWSSNAQATHRRAPSDDPDGSAQAEEASGAL